MSILSERHHRNFVILANIGSYISEFITS